MKNGPQVEGHSWMPWFLLCILFRMDLLIKFFKAISQDLELMGLRLDIFRQRKSQDKEHLEGNLPKLNFEEEKERGEDQGKKTRGDE